MQVILHHYPLSPYSEKIRLALGLALAETAGFPKRTVRRITRNPARKDVGS